MEKITVLIERTSGKPIEGDNPQIVKEMTLEEFYNFFQEQQWDFVISKDVPIFIAAQHEIDMRIEIYDDYRE
jgi:hypothetical protein